MARTGRPTKCTPENTRKICQRIAQGESLRSVCRDDDLPHQGTVCAWLADDRYKDFHEQYARACAARAERWAEEIVEIADNDDEVGDVQRDRLRVDARKWVACKLVPHRYGDRQKIEHSGTVGGVLTVPGISSPEDWDEFARKQQDAISRKRAGEDGEDEDAAAD